MIPKRLEKIAEELKKANWIKALQERVPIYIVGGTVRDAYQSKSIKDIDLIIENISMAKIKSILKEFGKVDIVGESFAVIKFRPFGHIGEDFDIAIPRKDIKIRDGHKGFTVQTDGVSLLEDLKRRDFTINSIALDLTRNIIIDPFFGLADLESGVIRATDESAFIDDPLRILRGIQFASRFGFIIESNTMDMMKEHSSKIKDISGERIFEEFMKIINKEGSVKTAFELIKDTGLDLVLFGWPMDNYTSTPDKLDLISFFWILAELGDINIELLLKDKLKAPTKLISDLNGLDLIIDSFRNRSGFNLWGDAEDLMIISKVITKNPELGKVDILPFEAFEITQEMNAGVIPKNNKDLKITGHDIMDFGINGMSVGLVNDQMLKDALTLKFNWKDRKESLNHLKTIVEDETFN